ncbi:MAG: M6 family metalloprotease domain-containing protein, partial [bacterium]|nr:M6 family metalloprotease domain-containing protein [bacterium]
MKPASVILATVSLTLLLLLPANRSAAMPPHPDLLEQIRAGEVPEPYYLSHHAELTARGLNAPMRTRSLHELLHRSLDEDLNILAILVDFSDNGQRTPADDFDVLLFDSARGSLRNYYQEVSYGNLTLTTVNVPGALGWQRAPQSYSYYVNHNNGFGSYPRNAQKLAEDAVHLVDAVVDFSRYDNDGDGYVDALFIVHAGPGAERTGNGNHIWSHMWSMNPQVVDGVTTEIYSMEPEFWNAPGDMTCGVYAHEMGHSVFGLPDFYDYDYDSEGLGKWSLMAGGSWNGPLGATPAHPDAWCRMTMGFVTPVCVTSDMPFVAIPNVETAPLIYRLWTNGNQGQQYFLVENRQRTGYDAAIPGEGLLIYHVDDQRHGNDNQWYPGYTEDGHYQVALEQADGLWNLEQNMNSGDGGDPFSTATGSNFTQLTVPDNRSYASQDTRVGVRRVSASGDTMTAGLYVGSASNLVFASIPDTAAVAGATVCVPMIVEDEIAAENVTRVQCRVTFDETLVTMTPPYYDIAAGLIPASWDVIEDHTTSGTITITAQGSTPLTGSGPLFCLHATLAVLAYEGDVSPLRFVELTFNQGTPAADTTSGSLTVIAPRLETTPFNVDFGYIRVGRPAMNGLVVR